MAGKSGKGKKKGVEALSTDDLVRELASRKKKVAESEFIYLRNIILI